MSVCVGASLFPAAPDGPDTCVAPRPPPRPPLARVPAHTHRGSRSTFPGMGPGAESNPAALRIKYGVIPKNSGICPNLARNQKWDIYIISLFSQAPVASWLCAKKTNASSRHVGQEARCARHRCAKAPSRRPGHTVWVPGERSAGRKSIRHITQSIVELAQTYVTRASNAPRPLKGRN